MSSQINFTSDGYGLRFQFMPQFKLLLVYTCKRIVKERGLETSALCTMESLGGIQGHLTQPNRKLYHKESLFKQMNNTVFESQLGLLKDITLLKNDHWIPHSNPADQGNAIQNK